MASLTFDAGSYKVTVRTRKVERPTGLARVGWNGHNDLNVTVRISPDELHLNVGSITCCEELNQYSISLGSVEGRWGHINTYRAMRQKTMTVLHTQEQALAVLSAYIKRSIEKRAQSND